MEYMRNKRWIEDLDMLSIELPKRHANLFFHKDKAEFYREIENLKRDIDYYDDYEVKAEISKIVASIKDAHTFVTLPVKVLCPLQFYWFKDGVYVINTLKEQQDPLYSKVLAINGIPMKEIIETLSQSISYENESYLKSQLPKYLPATELLYGLEIIDEFDYVHITFEDRCKNIRTLAIKALPINEVNEKLKLKINNGTESISLPLYRQNLDKYYWFKYLEDFKTVYFKYNACRNMGNKSVHEFGKKLISFINKNSVEKLVIDLRNNFGGDSTLLDPFIEKLKACEKLNEKGKLFVIVGRETFSSALLNALSLKKETNAIFIGEPTGGKPNCYGEVERFKLRNSGLQIAYSTKYYRVIENDKVLSFIPDINVEIGIEEYVSKEDPCLNYILENYNRV